MSESDAKDLISFFPRIDGAEMRTRFDIQVAPPDILITNYSMLSIMLMRDIDSEIFDKTREWLECKDVYSQNLNSEEKEQEKKNRVFHLIVDELHLYRGTQGTEVAYLLKLVLNRLGLHPGHPQLRILASSASLVADESEEGQKSLAFIQDFFGVADAKNDFVIVDGKILLSIFCQKTLTFYQQIHLYGFMMHIMIPEKISTVLLFRKHVE